VLFSVLPALQTSKPDVQETLKEGGRIAGAGASRQHTRSLLVIAEVALSLLLLVGAGLMIRTFISYQRINPGFRTDHLLTMKVALPAAKYREPQQRAAFFEQAIERIKALPGVQAACAVSELPLTADGGVLAFTVEGRPHLLAQDDPVAVWRAINPDFFRTMGMQLRRGRAFTAQDKPGAPEPVIVNETLANRFWPGEDPIGKRIQIYDLEPRPWREIVGVVDDIKSAALNADPVPEIYAPFSQRPRSIMTLIAHTTLKPERLTTAMRAAVQSLDKEQSVYRIRTMEQFFTDAVAAPRATTFLLGALAVTALLLAAVGVYSVMAYAMTQRTHEIGIRMALGARAGDVQRMVIKQGMTLTLAGVAAGLLASFGLTRLMKDLLFGVSATDPATFVMIPVLLTGIAILATLIPARKAMKVDPIAALREE
jgi:putative ABC transport system permease protein